ncbi:hypothetical protein, partial [Mesorhizobium sp. M7A.F.Ca.CA.002.03.2.1]|uniref:hypothetical protein n=1 Tax=Mesorhizobium sp. M7A.F.Ca.CA.002.03.2.1 TaxID=2496680 RepID=UPI0019D470AF
MLDHVTGNARVRQISIVMKIVNLRAGSFMPADIPQIHAAQRQDMTRDCPMRQLFCRATWTPSPTST